MRACQSAHLAMKQEAYSDVELLHDIHVTHVDIMRTELYALLQQRQLNTESM